MYWNLANNTACGSKFLCVFDKRPVMFHFLDADDCQQKFLRAKLSFQEDIAFKAKQKAQQKASAFFVTFDVANSFRLQADADLAAKLKAGKK